MIGFIDVVQLALGAQAPAPGTYPHMICPDRRVVSCFPGERWVYGAIPRVRIAPAVLLILESPHKEEFRLRNGVFSVVGPAADHRQGRTGSRIHKYLRSRYLPTINRYTPEMPIFLINAVQHQCSLNRDTDIYRSKVFKTAWINGYERAFIHRLRRYYRDGDIVVNACTGTSDQHACENLKMMVENGIIAALSSRPGRSVAVAEWGHSVRPFSSDLGIYHPSSKSFENSPAVWTHPG